jgi:hypothetical protein
MHGNRIVYSFYPAWVDSTGLHSISPSSHCEQEHVDFFLIPPLKRRRNAIRLPIEPVLHATHGDIEQLD